MSEFADRMREFADRMHCPECSAPYEVLTLYIDIAAGPFYGCDECGWVELERPAWSTERVLESFAEHDAKKDQL